MSSVDTRHPLYTDRYDEWSQMRHCQRGSVAIKRETTKYLPMPSGFAEQPDAGTAMYTAYRARGRFPDITNPTVRGMVGIIHRKDAAIEMPKQMEPLLEQSTKEGLPLEAFHRRITAELLLLGRFGILTDAAVDGSVPYLAGYVAETILNWSDDSDFFVLDESTRVRESYTWREHKQYRVLELIDGVYHQRIFNGVESLSTDGVDIIPTKAGNGGTLDKIPFVIMSAHDLQPPPREIPLWGVSDSSITIYQLDADYRHQLFMSGQETFVIIGADKPPAVVGAAVRLAIPIGGDAKYVGPSGSGIAAHRQAIIDAKDDAVAAGAQLFDTERKNTQESGEAKELRYTAQTATLTTIAQTSAQGLEAALRNVAEFMGLDPETVTVVPDLQFIDTVMAPAEGESLMRLWMGGAISKLTMYENLQRGEIASQERTFEEEQVLIEQDEIDKPQPALPGAADDDNLDEEDLTDEEKAAAKKKADEEARKKEEAV